MTAVDNGARYEDDDLWTGWSTLRAPQGYLDCEERGSNRNARPASVTRRSRQSKPDQEDRLWTTEMTASTQSLGLPMRFYSSPRNPICRQPRLSNVNLADVDFFRRSDLPPQP